MVQDYAGNSIVTSSSLPMENAYHTYYAQYIVLTKVNKAGNTNWTTQYSSPDSIGWINDQRCVADAVGNSYVAASTSTEARKMAERSAMCS